MRYLLSLFTLIFTSGILQAQDNLGLLLVSGVEDAQTFTGDYIGPGVEGVMYSRTGGWYQTAEVKYPFGFEISVIANASLNMDQHQTFVLDVNDYQNLQFPNGDTSREVATILGHNDPPVDVLLTSKSNAGSEEMLFRLPQGLGSSGFDVIPTAFIQARLGLFKGTEIKARYFPVRSFEDVNVDLYGGAVQHEFTSWLPAPDLFPVAVSGMVAYSVMDATYDFTEDEIMTGDNHHLDATMNYWLFSAIVSTNLPVLNVYGGISYLNGSSETDMLGNFTIMNEDTGMTVASVTDPLSISRAVEGYKANLGLSVRLGLFKINAEYNFQKYETISAGLHIGI